MRDDTVFVSDDTLWDLRFTPLADLILGYRLQVLRDNRYQTVTAQDAENSDGLFDWLFNSATKISAVQVRAVASLTLILVHPYSTTLVNITEDNIPGFRRELTYNGNVYANEFYAHYDTSSNFVG